MFSGSFVALVTPFTQDHKIDFDSYKSLIEWHISSGTAGIVVAGTTGESPTLSEDEKVELAQVAVETSQGRIKIIVGNGGNNTSACISLTKQLNKVGVDGYLTVTPFYNNPTDTGLIAHFTAIAQSTQLPIILYNVPGRTLCDLSNEIVIKLSELSNVVGIKDATGDLSRVNVLAQHCQLPFVQLSGDDESSLAYCLAGGHGVISVTANIVPAQMADIQAAIKREDKNQAEILDQQIAELHKNLFIESNPMAAKWALFYLKKIKNAVMRLPLVTLSALGREKIEQTIVDLNIN